MNMKKIGAVALISVLLVAAIAGGVWWVVTDRDETGTVEVTQNRYR